MNKTNPPTTDIEKEITVEEVERWIEKMESLTSEGARIVHVKHLLERGKHSLIQEIKSKLPEKTQVPNKIDNYGLYEWIHGYNTAIDEVLIILVPNKLEK